MSDAQDYHDKKNRAVYDDMRKAMRDFHGRELPGDVQELVEKAFADAEKATPDHVLRTQVMDPRIPKNEREQWAAGRIAELEAENQRLREIEASGYKLLVWASAMLRVYADYPAGRIAEFIDWKEDLKLLRKKREES